MKRKKEKKLNTSRGIENIMTLDRLGLYLYTGILSSPRHHGKAKNERFKQPTYRTFTKGFLSFACICERARD